MKRTQIGALFGEVGYYISQPGDDLDSPSKALLLDSRYDTLDIHAYGRNRYNRETLDNQSWFFSLGEVSFPSLGYMPMFQIVPVRNNLNQIYYPNTWEFDSNQQFQEFKAELKGSGLNQIHTEFRVLNDTPYTVDFFWIIYRNSW